jgi:hypothetical protein
MSLLKSMLTAMGFSSKFPLFQIRMRVRLTPQQGGDGTVHRIIVINDTGASRLCSTLEIPKGIPAGKGTLRSVMRAVQQIVIGGLYKFS